MSSNFDIEFSSIDYGILIAYFVLLFSGKAIWKLFKKEDSKKENLESYFLAARKLSLPAFIATLVTTWYGNMLGVFEMAYKHGIIEWITQGVFWYAMYIFFAFFMADKIRDSALFTLPDQLEKFYDKKTALIASIANIIMLNPASYILSIGIIMQILFSCNKELGILIGTLIPFLYLIQGGFKAVVFTDMIQFIFMFLGLFLLIPFALAKYGLSFFLENLPNSHLNIAQSLSTNSELGWQVVLAWLVIATWTLVDTSFYQRTYAAKDIKTAKKGILMATIFWFVFDLMISMTGIFAFTVDPQMNPANALPLFANDVLPSIAKGIFFTGILATVMSTLDSLTFSSAMCLSKDIYQRVFKITDEKKVILFNKFALVFVVSLGLIVAINFESLIKITYYKGSIGISALLLPLLSGFFLKKKMPATFAFASVLMGLSSCIIWIVCKKLGLINLDIEAIFIGLSFSSIPLVLHLIK